MMVGRRYLLARPTETRSALALAALAMAMLTLAADRVALWDLGVIKRRVERLFQIALAPAAPPKPTDYESEAPARLSEEVKREKMKEIFKFPAEVDSPPEAPLAFSPSALQPPTLSSAPLFSPMAAASREMPPRDLPLLAQRPSPRRPADVRLEDFYRAPAALPERPGGEIFSLADADEAISPQPPEPNPRQTLTSPPESVGAVCRRLVDERPAEGYPSLDNDLVADFSVYRPPGESEAYFELSLALKAASALPTMAKDILFLVDVSQSISNSELRLAREAVVEYLGTLKADDGWNIMIFSEESEALIKDVIFAPPSRFEADKARRFIDRRPDQRRTDVFLATQQILAGLPRGDRPCNVFLLSDGKPTQGISDVHSIVHDFARVNRDNFSIFPFDAGPIGNEYLLRLLAYRSRGFAAFCPQIDRLRPALLAFLREFEEPVITHVVWSHTGERAREVYPPVLPNLYRHHPIVIWGKTAPGRTVAVRLAGITAQGPREFFFRAVVPEGDDRCPEIRQRWAESQCHEMIARLAEQPGDRDLRQRIVDLARLHQLTYIATLLEEKPLFPWPWR